MRVQPRGITHVHICSEQEPEPTAMRMQRRERPGQEHIAAGPSQQTVALMIQLKKCDRLQMLSLIHI